MSDAYLRPTWAEVDLGAIAHNVRSLLALAHPAELCAVVKADGYGHGAVAVATAALEAGATRLAVALVEEGMALREAGIAPPVPVLVLSEPPPAAMAAAVAAHLTPTLYTLAGVRAAAEAVGNRRPLDVEVKVDTGMHRVGGTPDEVLAVAQAVHDSPHLVLAGLWTHLAAADEVENPYTAEQLERFEVVRDKLAAAGLLPGLLHAANSAGAMVHPAARYDMVRAGIALYGHAPSPALAALCDLRPSLSLKSRVTFLKEVEEGERASYGLRWTAPARTVVATVPIGYADGFPRRWGEQGGCVLVGGHRRPLAGTVTMDQILVDCGPPGSCPVQVGDEVVLIGRQGSEQITAEEWATALGTINYEVLCGIGPRVRRVYVGGPGEGETVQGVLG